MILLSNFFTLVKSHVLVVVLALLVIPFPTRTIPEWKLAVLDRADMKQLSNVQVEVTWTNYDHPFGDGIEFKRSDENGEAIFPSRWQWGNCLSRVAFFILAKVSTLTHGSDGLSISARVWDPEKHYFSSSDDQIHWYSNWNSGQQLPMQIFGTESPD